MVSDASHPHAATTNLHGIVGHSGGDDCDRSQDAKQAQDACKLHDAAEAKE